MRRWSMMMTSLLAAGYVVACIVQTRPAPAPGTAPATPAAATGALTWTDMAYAYHGLLLDSRAHEIKLDRKVIEQLQDSMLQSLTADLGTLGLALPKGAVTTPVLDPAVVKKVVSGFAYSDDERLLVKNLLLRQALGALPKAADEAYRWRMDQLLEKSLGIGPATLSVRPELLEYLRAAGLHVVLGDLTARITPDPAYNQNCHDNEVPVPPDWPDGWRGLGVTQPRGTLPWRFNFLCSGRDTEVWTYESTDPLGVCYALPRQSPTATGMYIALVGIICQSKRTGKACFWDNIVTTPPGTYRRVEGVGITLRIAELANGSNLTENCTQCHRGGNVFNIHPETVLGAVSADLRTPDVRYTPMGQAAWSNPPPFRAQDGRGCTGCHEIADLGSGVCRFVRRAAQTSMPSQDAPAGWLVPNLRHMGLFAADLDALRTACPVELESCEP